MMKKSVVKKCGGYIKLRRKEDFDLFSRIVTAGYYVRNIEISGTVITVGGPMTQTAKINGMPTPILNGVVPNTLGIKP